MNKRILSLFLALLLLCGCVPIQSTTLTTAAPYPESSLPQSEQYEEKKLIAQKQFLRLEEDLFREEISDNLLNMHFLLRNPALYGITSAKSLYASASLSSMEESSKSYVELQKQLEDLNPTDLTDQQKLTYRVLQSYLNIASKGNGLELYQQPIAPTIGIQAQLPMLLCEYAFTCKQDVEDYLSLLDGIDEYFQEIMAFEALVAEAGLMMSDATLDQIITSCESYLLVPGNNFMITTFNQRLDEINDLTDAEKADFQHRNAMLLEESFVPAYQSMIDGLQKFKGKGTNENGLCYFPDGKKYYEYLVYSATGTSYSSVDDLLDAVSSAINQYLKETSSLLKENPQLLEKVKSYSFNQTDPNGIMEELKSAASVDFPALPECNYTFRSIPSDLELTLSPAFYLTTAIDDPRNNVIYINENPRYASTQRYPIIAHEGYPGHLYQSVYFHTNCGSDLRKILPFPGYTEGWASYVEVLSYTMDNGLESDVGRVLSANYLANLGLHAYLDIAVNYLGWKEKDLEKYLSHYHSNSQELAPALYQRLVENPANTLSYFIGCLEILNMRETAEKELGSKFNLKEFHTFILDMGDAPFDVIQAYFTTWLLEQKL